MTKVEVFVPQDFTDEQLHRAIREAREAWERASAEADTASNWLNELVCELEARDAKANERE